MSCIDGPLAASLAGKDRCDLGMRKRRKEALEVCISEKHESVSSSDTEGGKREREA